MDSADKHLSLESLFGRYYSDLVSFIRAKYRKQHVCAEDIAQDAFLRLQRIENIQSLKNPRAHLYKTASNLAIDQFRRNKLMEKYLSFHHEKTDEDRGNTPEKITELEMKLSILDKKLYELPPKCRQAFILHRVHGYSYKEIAKELSVSVSSIDKYLFQALVFCRQILIEESDNEQ